MYTLTTTLYTNTYLSHAKYLVLYMVIPLGYHTSTVTFHKYTKTFPISAVFRWQAGIDRWDLNHDSKPDPYEKQLTSKSLL